MIWHRVRVPHLRPWCLATLGPLGISSRVLRRRLIRHIIGRSVAPILLVHGTDDATVPVTDAQRLHAQVPDRGTLLLLPATDHAGLDAIQESKPALLRFLRDAGVRIRGRSALTREPPRTGSGRGHILQGWRQPP